MYRTVSNGNSVKRQYALSEAPLFMALFIYINNCVTAIRRQLSAISQCRIIGSIFITCGLFIGNRHCLWHYLFTLAIALELSAVSNQLSANAALHCRYLFPRLFVALFIYISNCLTAISRQPKLHYSVDIYLH